jgi:hypothetical protein
LSAAEKRERNRLAQQKHRQRIAEEKKRKEGRIAYLEKTLEALAVSIANSDFEKARLTILATDYGDKQAQYTVGANSQIILSNSLEMWPDTIYPLPYSDFEISSDLSVTPFRSILVDTSSNNLALDPLLLELKEGTS